MFLCTRLRILHYASQDACKFIVRQQFALCALLFWSWYVLQRALSDIVTNPTTARRLLLLVNEGREHKPRRFTNIVQAHLPRPRPRALAVHTPNPFWHV